MKTRLYVDNLSELSNPPDNFIVGRPITDMIELSYCKPDFMDIHQLTAQHVFLQANDCIWFKF